MAVRTAQTEELAQVMNILDGSFLSTDAGEIRERIENGEVLVAVDDGRLLGVLVLKGSEVISIAVRPRRRGQGVGAALVTAAFERRGQITAEFRAELRPFYESLGFDIETAPGDRRLRGTLENPP